MLGFVGKTPREDSPNLILRSRFHVRVRVRACERASVRACERASVRVYLYPLWFKATGA